MAVKSDVRRNLIGSQMTQANVRNLWRPVVPEETAEALQETAGVIAQQHKEQEKIAFERLSLEAAKMQQEELEQIRMVETADVIPGLEADFQNRVKQQFAADKWGKKWLEKRGDVFFSGNSVDVARARAAKEEELTILETDKVLKSFADEAALGTPDKAAYYLAKAGSFVDNMALTPEQKRQAMGNYNKLWVTGMVEHNAANAVGVLAGDMPIAGISDIERAGYLERAKGILDARAAEARAAEKRANEKLKLTNAMKIAELDVALTNGKAGVDDIEKAKADGVYDLQPSAYAKSYQYLNKADGKLSDAETLKRVQGEVLAGTATRESIIQAQYDGLLTRGDAENFIEDLGRLHPEKKETTENRYDEEIRELRNEYNQGRLTREALNNRLNADEISYKAYEEADGWFAADDKREKEASVAAEKTAEAKREDDANRGIVGDILAYKLNSSAVINQKYADGEFSQEVRDDALQTLDRRKSEDKARLAEYKNFSDEQTEKALITLIDEGKITIQEQLNAYRNDKENPISKPVWQAASAYLKEYNARKSAEAAETEKISRREKEKDELKAYYADSYAIDSGVIITEREIDNNVLNGRYGEARGKELKERLNKKKAADGTLPEGKKAEMVLTLYDDLQNLSAPGTTIEDFERLNNKIIDYMDSKVLPKAEGEKMLNTFSLAYMGKYQEDLEQYGETRLLTADEGFPALNGWMEDTFGREPRKADYNKTAEQRAEYDAIMGARARNAVAVYQLYADALDIVAKENNLDSAADIVALDNKVLRSRIYGAAVELTKRTWAKNRYRSLENQVVNPTAVLSGRDGLVRISAERGITGEAGASGTVGASGGQKLNEERVTGTAYDPVTGRYGLQFSNGEIREVSRDVYQQYGGSY